MTAVEPQQRRGGRRSNVYLDGEYAFSLATDVALELRAGDELSAEGTAALLERDQIHVALDAALNDSNTPFLNRVGTGANGG